MRPTRSNILAFEDFLITESAIMEIATEEAPLFDYEQIAFGEEDGTFMWKIWVTDKDSVSDEMTLRIEYSKDPMKGKEMQLWLDKFLDVLYCLEMIDGDDTSQTVALTENFDTRKWSSLLDIAEVDMFGRKSSYEVTGYGKAVALKLLRTRFHIIREWIEKFRPDFFLSKPKKENPDDTRRLNIYELYFKKYLPGYTVRSRDMSLIKPWFDTDLLTCISNRVNDRTLSAIESDVESALY